MSKKLAILIAALAVLAAIGLTAVGPQNPGTRARLGGAAASPAAVEWSAPVTISRPNQHSTAPVLSLDAKGQAYVSWTEWTGAAWARNMMFGTNAGGAWKPALVVAPLDYDSIDDVGFPTVAATPSGAAWVAYHDADFALNHMIIKGARYADGAMGPAVNISQTPGATSYVVLGVSPLDETLHATWMDNTAREWDLVTRFRDGITGQWVEPDFLPFQRNISKATYQIQHFAFDPRGTAHLVYQTRFDKAQVWYTQNRTPKNLATWTEPFNVAPNTLLSDVLPRVQADADGDAYVVWHEIVNGNEEALLRRTVSGAWQATENISQSAAASQNPSVAVDPASKEIFVVWQEQAAGSFWDIFLNSYLKQAGTGAFAWTGPVNLTKTAGRSLEPYIAATAGGNLYLVYQEEVPGSGGKAAILFTSKVTPPKPKLQAPLSPALKTQINRVLFAARKANVVTFAANEANDAATLQEYRVYRRLAQDPDETFSLVATLGLGTFGYKDANLSTKFKYAYQVGIVNKDGEEKRTDVVLEK